MTAKHQLCRQLIRCALIIVALTALHGLTEYTSVNAQERPPNIILIIGDDHGFPYFGFTGSEHVHTPNMDLLAAEGAVFMLGHVTDNHCRPSLQTLMTGLHPIQYDNRADGYHAAAIRQNEAYASASDEEKRFWDLNFYHHVMQEFDTLPRWLSEAGYASFQGGKWWEQSYKTGGFTEGMSKGWSMERRGQEGWFHEFMGGEGMALARETMDPVYDFIDRHEGQPFFIWYGPSLPHTPLNPPFKYYKYYAETELSVSAKEYYGNCTWFDAGVGDLIDYIEEKGLRENTLMIYVNDNGWDQPPFEEYKGINSLYSNGGNKGKLTLHDQAFRTPIIFHWPGRISPQVFDDNLVSSMDLVPSILEYAGLSLPAGLPGHSLRSVIAGASNSMRDQLIGRITQHRSETDVMGRRLEGYYLRTARWHFMWYRSENRMELYDMQADPAATRDVLTDHPELADQFQKQILAWKAEMEIR